MKREPRQRLVVRATVNGRSREMDVEARTSLADALRDHGLKGVHLGCEQGVCGACTVLMEGEPVRSCLLLAAQCEGAEVTTVEGLAEAGELSPLQTAFWEDHGFQCGFCTPGILLGVRALLEENPDPTEGEVREALAGHLCRCTGYEDIVTSVRDAAARLRAGQGG